MKASHPLRSLAIVIFALFGLAACNELAALSGPTHRYVIEADAEQLQRAASKGGADAVIERSMDVIRERLDAVGVYTHRIEALGDGRVLLETSGNDSSDPIYTLVGIQADLEIRLVDELALPRNTIAGIANPGSELLPLRDWNEMIAVRRLGGIDGSHIVRATASRDAMTNEFIVNVQFDEVGGDRFAEITRDNVGKRLAIVVDDEVISAPVVNEPIQGGSVQISGQFTYDSASELAILLRSGTLPVPFAVLDETTITD